MSIKLHGIIARRFEKELDIPPEIDESFLFEILNMKFNGFRLFIQRQAQEGVFYETVKVDEDYHIVPVIVGSVGAILGAITSQLFTSFLGSFATNAIIGGIMGMISPVEEEQTAGAESAVILQGSRFSGLENKTRQGSKVPIGYGRLRIGSKLIMQYARPIEWSSYRQIENQDNFDGIQNLYLNPAI